MPSFQTLAPEDHTLAIAQASFRGIERQRTATAKLEALIRETIRPAITAVLEGSDDEEKMQKAVMEVVKAHIKALYQQQEGVGIEESIDTREAAWVLQPMQEEADEAYSEHLRAYIGSVAELIAQNIVTIYRAGRHRHQTRQILNAAYHLAKGHDAAFSEAYFKGNAIAEYLEKDPELKDHAEEAKTIILQRVRLHFACQNPRDPRKGIAHALRNLKLVLTDENIGKAITEEGFNIVPDETEEKNLRPDQLRPKDIKKNFPPSARLKIAVYNIKKPLDAVKRIVHNVKTTLTDDNIHSALAHKKISLTPEEISRIFTASIRIYLASNNIKRPLKAIEAIGDNIKNHLKDAAIKATLSEEGIILENRELNEIFIPSARIHIALRFRKPKEGIRKLAHNVKNILTDQKIQEALRSEGKNLRVDQVRAIFSRTVRWYLAIGYPRDPLRACVRYINGEIMACGRRCPSLSSNGQ